MSKKFIACLLAVAAGLFVCEGMTQAQVKKGKTRAALTKQIMKGLVKVNCDGIKQGLDAGPQKDKDWEDLATSAALLNEASYILVDDGRAPDGVWTDAASKLLRDGSASVLKAAEAKDIDGAKKAFGDMTKACGTCHKAHRK